MIVSLNLIPCRCGRRPVAVFNPNGNHYEAICQHCHFAIIAKTRDRVELAWNQHACGAAHEPVTDHEAAHGLDPRCDVYNQKHDLGGHVDEMV